MCASLSVQVDQDNLSDTEAKVTRHHAAHDKEGQGRFWSICFVVLLQGQGFSLALCVLLREALLDDLLQGHSDRKGSTHMQHLQGTGGVWPLTLADHGKGLKVWGPDPETPKSQKKVYQGSGQAT